MELVLASKCVTALKRYSDSLVVSMQKKLKIEKNELSKIRKQINSAKDFTEILPTNIFPSNYFVPNIILNCLVTLGHIYKSPSHDDSTYISNLVKLDIFRMVNSWFKSHRNEFAYLLYQAKNRDRLIVDYKLRSKLEHMIYVDFIKRLEFAANISTVDYFIATWPDEVLLDIKKQKLSRKTLLYIQHSGITQTMLKNFNGEQDKLFIFKGVSKLKGKFSELAKFLDQVNIKTINPIFKTEEIPFYKHSKNIKQYWKGSDPIFYRTKFKTGNTDNKQPNWSKTYNAVIPVNNGHAGIVIEPKAMCLVLSTGDFGSNYLGIVKRDPMLFVMFYLGKNHRLLFFDSKKVKFLLTKLKGKVDNYKLIVDEKFLKSECYLVFYKQKKVVGILKNEKLIV